MFGSVRVAESAEGFFKIVICWPNVRNLKKVLQITMAELKMRTGETRESTLSVEYHDGPWVPSKGVLQEAS